ncbi:SWIM-type domain-containing protein [Raphanus sativus]|nr:SWIM-type domain-containing protein [Raphanus sativus]
MGYSSTNIHFDYDGQYAKSGDDYEWIPSDGRLYGISFKTSSLDEITYSCLKERICKKKRIDPCLKRMNLSYIPLVVEPKRQSYILDDEDVYVYLTSVDKEGRRSILHVEVIEEMEQQSVVEKESSYGGNYSELASGLPEVEGNPGALTLVPRIEEAELYLPGAERVENVVINGKAEERGINVVNGEAEERGINVVNGEAEERGINVVNGEAGEGGVDSEGDVDNSMGVRPSSCFKNLRVKKL